MSHAAAVKLAHIRVRTSTLRSPLYEHYHVHLSIICMVRGMQCDVLGANCMRDIACGCIVSYTYVSCRILV